MSLALSTLSAVALAQQDDDVLARAGETAIRIGAYSPFAIFLDRLPKIRERCPPPANPLAAGDGPLRIGEATRRLIAEIAACDQVIALPVGSPARQGAITHALWRAVVPELPVPSVADRVEALTLTFEATDFSDPAEWNFCQDTPGKPGERAAAVAAGASCFNATDPCSMLTWGPRGATAGQGAEIQWIFWKLYRQAPQVLASAFEAEYANVERFVRMKPPSPTSCDGSSALEHFMCAVWIDEPRRRAWQTGLRALGRSEVVRQVYNRLYAAYEFDGYKMQAYLETWRRAGLVATEVDFAFFFDRATHIGSPPADGSPERVKLERCLATASAAKSPNAAARRCLAIAHPHPTQPVDRLGRDVAYYRSAFPDAVLAGRELDTWRGHIPVDAAADIGLSDDRAMPREAFATEKLAIEDRPPGDLEMLTATERSCPAAIRNPLRRHPP